MPERRVGNPGKDVKSVVRGVTRDNDFSNRMLYRGEGANVFLFEIGRQALPFSPDQHETRMVLFQEEDDENLYSSIQQLRDRANELSDQVSHFEHSNNCDSRYQQRLDELRVAQERLMELTEVRNRK